MLRLPSARSPGSFVPVLLVALVLLALLALVLAISLAAAMAILGAILLCPERAEKLAGALQGMDPHTSPAVRELLLR